MKTNDLTPYVKGPTPATPMAGQGFLDPVFQSPILRVTDEHDDSGGMFAPAYSAIYDSFNVDSSRLLWYSLTGAGWVGDLDVAGRAIANKRRVSKLGTNSATYWSRVNPNALYLLEGWNAANLWRYDFRSDRWTLLVDLSKLLPAAPPDTTWVSGRGMSWDDNRFHVAAPGGHYVYDVKLGRLIGPFTLAMAQATGWNPQDAAYLFGKSTMDSAGKCFWTADTQLIFNVETGATFRPMFGTPSNVYGDVHADVGLGNVLASCGGIPALNDGVYPVVFTLDPANLQTYMAPRRAIGPRFLWGYDSHSSYRDRTGKWANYDLDGTPIGADAGKVAVFNDQEIFQLSILSPADGSINQRIAHAYSDPSSFSDAGTRYWAQPHASQSQDNRAVCFNSTYGNKRIDVYVAFLDAPSSPPGGGVILDDSTLAGVPFTTDMAKVLSNFALSQLATARGGRRG